MIRKEFQYHPYGDTTAREEWIEIICDKCGEEVDKLYKYDGEQWCEYCILDDLGEVDYTKEKR